MSVNNLPAEPSKHSSYAQYTDENQPQENVTHVSAESREKSNFALVKELLNDGKNTESSFNGNQ